MRNSEASKKGNAGGTSSGSIHRLPGAGSPPDGDGPDQRRGKKAPFSFKLDDNLRAELEAWCLENGGSGMPLSSAIHLAIARMIKKP